MCFQPSLRLEGYDMRVLSWVVPGIIVILIVPLKSMAEDRVPDSS